MGGRADTQRAHIEGIRAEYSGLARRPLESLQNALAHLSTELYSRKAHFLFELIQNADDNRYPPECEPELTFDLRTNDPTGTPGADGCLVISNNECGFRPEDVDALCRLGKSTKNRSEGYIGEKGIGFKSVFQASRRPHVFSGGYAFRFDKDAVAGSVGYISPIWVDEPPDLLATAATTIVLPLEPGDREGLRTNLSSLHPSTLLFLRRLRRLRVAHDGAIVRSLQLGTLLQAGPWLSLVELTTETAAATRFWIYRHEVRRPEAIVEEKREHIQETAVTLALPLDDKAAEDGRVFVFLPTELRSGFPFLINADFLTTPSREDIHVERPWNLWLRDELGTGLAHAILALAELAENGSSSPALAPGPCIPYRLVPDPARLQRPAFFLPAWERARAALEHQSIVRCTTAVGGHHVLATPVESRRAPDSLRRLLLPPGDACPSLSETIRVADAALEEASTALATLGTTDFAPSDLGAVLEGAWLARRPASWFVELYSVCAELSWIPPDGAPLVPTDAGFASKDDRVCLAARDVTGGLPPPLAERLHLRFVRSDLAEALRSHDAALAWLRRACRVVPATPTDIIEETLLPNIKLEDGEDLLLDAARYVARHWDTLTRSTREKVGRTLPRIESRRSDRPEWNLVAMPAAFCPELGWQVAFPSAEDGPHLSVLSDSYLRAEDPELPRLVELLRAMGATETPRPHVAVTKRHNERDAFERELYDRFQRPGRDVRTVTNSRPPRWLRDLRRGASPSEALPRIRALALWLDRWSRQSPAPHWWKTTIELWEGRVRAEEVDSELLEVLRTAPWVPSTAGLQPPGAVFVDCPKNRALFGKSVPYVTDLDVGLLPVLARYGLSQEATPQTAVRFLRECSAGSLAPAQEAALVLYRLLLAGQERPEPGERIVYVPGAEPPWRGTSEVVWADTEPALDGKYPALEKVYPGLRELFVALWKVREDAEVGDYIAAWSDMPRRRIPPKKVEEALEQIYKRVAPVAAERRHLLAKMPLWTRDRTFARPPVYVADDAVLERRFAGRARYVWKPSSRKLEPLVPLYEAAGARLLSASVRARVLDQSATPIERRRLLTAGARKLLAFELWSRWEDEWSDRRDAVADLLGLVETEFADLVVRYQLGAASVDAYDLTAYAGEGRLYVRRGTSLEEARHEAAIAITRGVLRSRESEVENIAFRALTASVAWAEREIARRTLRQPPDSVVRGLDSSREQAAPDPSEAPDSRADAGAAVASRASVDSQSRVAPGNPSGPPATATARSPGPACAREASGTDSGPDARDEADNSGADEDAVGLARWLLNLQREPAPDRDLSGPAPQGGPKTAASARLDLAASRAVQPDERTRDVVRHERVLSDVADQHRERARQMLADYGGRCQVCGATFVQANGEIDIVATQWQPAVRAGGELHYGNLLALCAWHAAMLRRGRFTLLDAQGMPFPDVAALGSFVRAGGIQEHGGDGERTHSLPIRFHNVLAAGETVTRDHDACIRYCPPHWEYFLVLLAEGSGS